jgi:CheY-like chemotaxis protein
MALDQIETMRHFGHEPFLVGAHDRGARVAHRLCLDFPKSVKKVCLMDIAPTLTMYRQTNQEFATKYMGIVRGHKGALKVYSTPGQGSTFKILFPAMQDGRQPAAAKPGITLTPAHHTGAVLVIDDEEVVRRTAKTTLERNGYDILLAENGFEGVQLFQALANKICAVLLDLTMPGLGGEETLRQIQAIRPEARVILSSGFNEMEVIRKFAERVWPASCKSHTRPRR